MPNRGKPDGWEEELAFIQAMTKEERKLFFEEEGLKAEEHLLQSMIDSNKADDKLAEGFGKMARIVLEDNVTKAEEYVELAKGVANGKYTLKDTREQRRRVQWQRTKVNKLRTKQQSEEPKPSSSP